MLISFALNVVLVTFRRHGPDGARFATTFVQMIVCYDNTDKPTKSVDQDSVDFAMLVINPHQTE